MLIIFSPDILHRYLSSRWLHLLISSSLLSNLSFLSFSVPPFSVLVYFFSLVCFSFVLLLQGHDAVPCAVLKSVDSFSFLQHPVHQRSLEILQRCKEENYSKAAYTTITPPTIMLDHDLGNCRDKLTNIINFTETKVKPKYIKITITVKLKDVVSQSFYFLLCGFIYSSLFSITRLDACWSLLPLSPSHPLLCTWMHLSRLACSLACFTQSATISMLV